MSTLKNQCTSFHRKQIPKRPLFPRFGSACAAPLLLAGALLFSPQAHGAVQLTTLGNPVLGPAPIGQGNAFGFAFVLNNQAYTLNSITAEIREMTPGNSTLLAVLYTASSTPGPDYRMPTGSLLTTFSYSGITSSYSDVVFTPNTPVTLQPNQAYAMALLAIPAGSDPVPTSWGWGLGLSTDGYGPLGTDWSAVFLLPFSADNTTWSAFNNGDTDYLLNFAVDATAVPEPSAFLLVAAGAGLCWHLRRRRAA